MKLAVLMVSVCGPTRRMVSKPTPASQCSRNRPPVPSSSKETMQISSDAGTAIPASRKRKLWVKVGTLREARYLQTLQAKHAELDAGYLELFDRRRAATA